jgi:isopentenyl-diphosphate delta-isomerase
MTQSLGSHRKDEHVILAEKYYTETATAGFADVRLIHTALPEVDLRHVSVTPTVFGWHWPFFINAMTGGSPQTGRYNAALGRLAAGADLAIASGSQSVALREPALVPTFTVLRENHPAGFILANLGAGHPWADAQAAIAMLAANALELHVNSVQELVMPEGDRDLRWLANIGDIVAQSPVPVIVKEIGNGMSAATVARLQSVGVKYIDVGGRGGTNFVTIENTRRPARDYGYLEGFGQTTVESLLETQGLTRIATGGIRNPLDILKALRLGASAVGVSGQVLHWLIQEGEPATAAHLASWQGQLPQVLGVLGASNLAELTQVPVVLSPTLESYVRQRGLMLPQ